MNTKYSSVTLFDDKGKKIKDLKPITTGWSQTVVFSSDQIVKGTNKVEWHAISADGHEVGDTYEFSVGKVTAKDVDTSSPFYEQSKFWFGLLRYVTEGATFLLIGLFWLNGIAKKRGLRQFNVLPKQSEIAWIMAMSVLVSLVVYMMTLTSDILEDILSFKLEVIMQFPYILSSISLIILFYTFRIKGYGKNMVLAHFNNYDCCDKYVWTRVVTTSAIMVNHHKNNSSYRANVMVRFTRISHLLCY